MQRYTRRGLFGMIGAAIAARRTARALKHYVAMDLAIHAGSRQGKSLLAARLVIEHLKAGRSVVLADSTGRYILTGKRHDEAA